MGVWRSRRTWRSGLGTCGVLVALIAGVGLSLEAHPRQEPRSLETAEPGGREPISTVVIALVFMDSTRESLAPRPRQDVTLNALGVARVKLQSAVGRLRSQSARMTDSPVRAGLEALAREAERAQAVVEGLESAGDLPDEVRRARLGETEKAWRTVSKLAPSVVEAHLDAADTFTVAERAFIMAYVLNWHGPGIAGWRRVSFDQLLESCPEVRLERLGEHYHYVDTATGAATGSSSVWSSTIVARPTDSPLIEAASAILSIVQRAASGPR